MDVSLHLRTAYGLTFLMFMSPMAKLPTLSGPTATLWGKMITLLSHGRTKHLVLENSGEVQHVSSTPSH